MVERIRRVTGLQFFGSVSKNRRGDNLPNITESFIRRSLPFGQVITVKLEAPKRVLYERLGKKKREEQGSEWPFSAAYPNKHEFVKKLYDEFKKLPAEITIDTSTLNPEKVSEAAMRELKQQMMLYSKLMVP